MVNRPETPDETERLGIMFQPSLRPSDDSRMRYGGMPQQNNQAPPYMNNGYSQPPKNNQEPPYMNSGYFQPPQNDQGPPYMNSDYGQPPHNNPGPQYVNTDYNQPPQKIPRNSMSQLYDPAAPLDAGHVPSRTYNGNVTTPADPTPNYYSNMRPEPPPEIFRHVSEPGRPSRFNPVDLTTEPYQAPGNREEDRIYDYSGKRPPWEEYRGGEFMRPERIGRPSSDEAGRNIAMVNPTGVPPPPHAPAPTEDDVNRFLHSYRQTREHKFFGMDDTINPVSVSQPYDSQNFLNREEQQVMVRYPDIDRRDKDEGFFRKSDFTRAVEEEQKTESDDFTYTRRRNVVVPKVSSTNPSDKSLNVDATNYARAIGLDSPTDGNTSGSVVSTFERRVTHVDGEVGFAGTDLFFQMSKVFGGVRPKLGDSVLVKAERVVSMPFTWNALSVQLLTPEEGKQMKLSANFQPPPAQFEQIPLMLPTSRSPRPIKSILKNKAAPPPPVISVPPVPVTRKNADTDRPPRKRSPSPESPIIVFEKVPTTKRSPSPKRRKGSPARRRSPAKKRSPSATMVPTLSPLRGLSPVSVASLRRRSPPTSRRISPVFKRKSPPRGEQRRRSISPEPYRRKSSFSPLRRRSKSPAVLRKHSPPRGRSSSSASSPRYTPSPGNSRKRRWSPSPERSRRRAPTPEICGRPSASPERSRRRSPSFKRRGRSPSSRSRRHPSKSPARNRSSSGRSHRRRSRSSSGSGSRRRRSRSSSRTRSQKKSTQVQVQKPPSKKPELQTIVLDLENEVAITAKKSKPIPVSFTWSKSLKEPPTVTGVLPKKTPVVVKKPKKAEQLPAYKLVTKEKSKAEKLAEIKQKIQVEKLKMAKEKIEKVKNDLKTAVLAKRTEQVTTPSQAPQPTPQPAPPPKPLQGPQVAPQLRMPNPMFAPSGHTAVPVPLPNMPQLSLPDPNLMVPQTYFHGLPTPYPPSVNNLQAHPAYQSCFPSPRPPMLPNQQRVYFANTFPPHQPGMTRFEPAVGPRREITGSEGFRRIITIARGAVLNVDNTRQATNSTNLVKNPLHKEANKNEPAPPGEESREPSNKPADTVVIQPATVQKSGVSKVTNVERTNSNATTTATSLKEKKQVESTNDKAEEEQVTIFIRSADQLFEEDSQPVEPSIKAPLVVMEDMNDDIDVMDPSIAFELGCHPDKVGRARNWMICIRCAQRGHLQEMCDKQRIPRALPFEISMAKELLEESRKQHFEEVAKLKEHEGQGEVSKVPTGKISKAPQGKSQDAGVGGASHRTENDSQLISHKKSSADSAHSNNVKEQETKSANADQLNKVGKEREGKVRPDTPNQPDDDKTLANPDKAPARKGPRPGPYSKTRAHLGPNEAANWSDEASKRSPAPTAQNPQGSSKSTDQVSTSCAAAEKSKVAGEAAKTGPPGGKPSDLPQSSGPPSQGTKTKDSSKQQAPMQLQSAVRVVGPVLSSKLTQRTKEQFELAMKESRQQGRPHSRNNSAEGRMMSGRISVPPPHGPPPRSDPILRISRRRSISPSHSSHSMIRDPMRAVAVKQLEIHELNLRDMELQREMEILMMERDRMGFGGWSEQRGGQMSHANPRGDGFCYVCLGRGHRGRDCRAPWPPWLRTKRRVREGTVIERAAGEPEPFCLACGKIGHFTRDCRYRAQCEVYSDDGGD